MTTKPQDQRDIEAREALQQINRALQIASNAAGKMAVSLLRGEHSLHRFEFEELARAELDIYAAADAAHALMTESARPAPEALGAAKGVSEAARDVLAERQRQMSVEGWTHEHDDQHISGTLAQAAGCYVEWNAWEAEYQREGAIPINWPWAAEWWKPSGDRRNLVKAAALIIAEIERLDRAAAKDQS